MSKHKNPSRRPGPNPESNPDPNPDSNPEINPEINPESNPEINPDSNPERNTLQQNATHYEISALTPRQLAALPSIAGSPNQAQAARSAGIDRTTLYRWLQDEDFREDLSRLREESAALARTELQAAMLHAVNVILDSTNSSNEVVRLRAARSLLNLGIKVNEIEKLRAELRLLQQAIEFATP